MVIVAHGARTPAAASAASSKLCLCLAVDDDERSSVIRLVWLALLGSHPAFGSAGDPVPGD
jgi:hypothetical protein